MSSNRYIRQEQLREFGKIGQNTLKNTSVLIVGAGGLGVPAATALNGMGVGRIGLVDQDIVEFSNLHRQPAYTEADVGTLKIECLKTFLQQRNRETKIESYPVYLQSKNALEIIETYDIVLDATDNFSSRYLIDDACRILDKPWVYGGLQGFEGQISVFNYKDGPSYRCLFPKMPTAHEIPDCNTNGILGVLPAIIGHLQALEVIKITLGSERVLSGYIALYDGITQEIQKIGISKNPENVTPEKLKDSYGFQGCNLPGGILVKEFLNLRSLKATLQVVDVRSKEEREVYQYPESLHLPMDRLKEYRSEISPKEPVVLICEKGPRSYLAYQELRDLDHFKELYWLDGGINALRESHN